MQLKKVLKKAVYGAKSDSESYEDTGGWTAAGGYLS